MTTLLDQQLYKIHNYPLDVSFIFANLEEELEKERKLEELRSDIGEKLFNSLSEEDKKFIIETEGIVDFGYELTEEDLKRVTKSIEEDYEY